MRANLSTIYNTHIQKWLALPMYSPLFQISLFFQATLLPVLHMHLNVQLFLTTNLNQWTKPKVSEIHNIQFYYVYHMFYAFEDYGRFEIMISICRLRPTDSEV